MSHIISVTLQNEKVVNIKIEKHKLQDFFTKFNTGKVFYNKTTEVGFWISKAEIKYMFICDERIQSDVLDPEKEIEIEKNLDSIEPKESASDIEQEELNFVEEEVKDEHKPFLKRIKDMCSPS